MKKRTKLNDLLKIENLFLFSNLKNYTKLVSKVLTECLKTSLPSLISSDQTTYLDGRFISEEWRLISAIFEASDLLKLKGLLPTVAIEKFFVNNHFLLKALENCGFSHDFLKWISILLQNNESRVVDSGKMTRYLPLKRGTRKGDTISA